MTVVVAAVTGDHVTIAADRQISAGWLVERHAEPKLWATDNGWAMGAAGCLRTAQVLKHHVTWPKFRPDEDTDLEAFLVKQVVPAIRRGAAGHGVVETDSGIESISAELLIASHNKLAVISGNGCVTSEPCGRMAIGSGYAEALGFLGDGGTWEESDVIDAARRACISAYGVGGPINVVTTATYKVRKVAAS
jgi:ATP-dependent protease HslVU (ClpYQ) peptidase subunit